MKGEGEGEGKEDKKGERGEVTSNDSQGDEVGGWGR